MLSPMKKAWDKFYLWLLTKWFVSIVTVASLFSGERMSHNNGIVGRGKLRIEDDPDFPEHDFFQAGKEFTIRLRHASASYVDDSQLVIRSATIKLADSNWESPLDIEMNTGKRALFWSAKNFYYFANNRNETKGFEYESYYDSDQIKFPEQFKELRQEYKRIDTLYTKLKLDETEDYAQLKEFGMILDDIEVFLQKLKGAIKKNPVVKDDFNFKGTLKDIDLLQVKINDFRNDKEDNSDQAKADLITQLINKIRLTINEGLFGSHVSVRFPDSFALLRYYSKTCFHFKAKDGKTRYCKYRLHPVPDVSDHGMPSEEVLKVLWDARALPGDTRSRSYLKHEYKKRVEEAPVHYKLQIQLHEWDETIDNEEVFNSHRYWSESTHPWITLGSVEINEILPYKDPKGDTSIDANRFMSSLSHQPDSLGVIEAKSVRDYNSVNYMRANSTSAKKARLIYYKLFGMPDDYSDDEKDWNRYYSEPGKRGEH